MKENIEYNIRPAPGTCCPDMEYRFLDLHVMSNGAVWEIQRCTGCDTLQRKFLAWMHEIKEAKESPK